MILRLLLVSGVINLVNIQNANGNLQMVNTLTYYMVQLEELYNQNSTSLCVKHIQEYFDGLGNQSKWAFEMLDSTSKLPGGFLKGNHKFFGLYDECLSVQHPNKSFVGKYCLVEVKDHLTSVGFIQKLAEERAGVFLAVPEKMNFYNDAFGVCLPSTCNAREILTLINKVTNATDDQLSVEERDCRIKEPRNIAQNDWIIICVLLGFVVIAAASTIYDILHSLCNRTGKPHPLLVSFSFYTNGKSLFSQSKIPGDIEPFYGLRVLSTNSVVLIHSAYFSSIGPAINYFDQLKMMTETSIFLYALLVNAHLAVDTFFFMSGFLVYVSFYRSIARTGSFDVPLAYIHRYIRLTSAFAAIIIIQWQLFQYLGDGPAWNLIVERVSNDCSRTWWKYLTYIQNYRSTFTICLTQAWYLAVDMQYYWLSPLILYPLHYKPKIGAILIFGLMLGSILSSFVRVLFNDLGPNPLMSRRIEGQFLKEYVHTDARASVWLIGLSMGYITYALKNKKINVKLSKLAVTAGWLTAIGLILCTHFGIIAFIDNKYTPLQSAYYVPLHRVGWALAISWIVFACMHGYGGFVNAFLSARAFKPLNKLSYCVFLVHTTVQMYHRASQRTNYYGNPGAYIYFYLGDLIFSLFFAALLTLLFEVPFCNITKILLKNAKILPVPHQKKVHVINDVKRENGRNELELGNVNRDSVRL